jgi:formamidopyrimidine-DNA glycosylase
MAEGSTMKKPVPLTTVLFVNHSREPMPELPEVETTLSIIAPDITGKTVSQVILRNPNLRWPVPAALAEILPGQTIQAVARRGKYLLFSCSTGTILLHLGMSGHLRILAATVPPGKHDHLDIIFNDGLCLRFNDPRRFGTVLWTVEDPLQHRLLAGLGPEPLENHFTGAYLFKQSRNRKIAVKLFIMDSHIVVGVGNIYANEALFRAGINPARAAGSLSESQYGQIAAAIRMVLLAAIAAGGSSLRDFAVSDSKPGYFQLQLNVYGRAGEACTMCGDALVHARLGGRATYFCSRCQR